MIESQMKGVRLQAWAHYVANIFKKLFLLSKNMSKIQNVVSNTYFMKIILEMDRDFSI